MLQDDDNDTVWHCDADFNLNSHTDSNLLRKVQAKIHSEGYVIGKLQGEPLLMQQGFDNGFKKGMIIGKSCGEIYALVKITLENINSLNNEEMLHKIERNIFIDIPEAFENIEEVLSIFSNIRDILTSASVELTSEIKTFDACIEKMNNLLREM